VPEALPRASTGFDDYKHIIALTNQHPTLTPLVPQYQPDPSWTDGQCNRILKLNVVGFAKMGASQLCKILRSYPDATPDN
jgi:hypothetical protein